MKPVFSFLLLSIFFFSCMQKEKGSTSAMSKYLNPTKLESQIFELNTTKDNTLITKNGTYIQIEKGSIISNQAIIKLEIKEALTMEEIMLAGLITRADGKPLSSGGMIYINAAAGYTIEIKKALKVFIPTENYDEKMQLYKGKIMPDSSMNWEDPTALAKNEKLDHGEQLFISNCKSCHGIDKSLTGPALWNVQNRRSKEWLYAFTRNPAQLIWNTKTRTECINVVPSTPESDSTRRVLNKTSSNRRARTSLRDTIIRRSDYYAKCIYNQWIRTMMTSFPNLSDKDLEDLYSYIKKESDKHPELASMFGANCCDSCEKYEVGLMNLQAERMKLIEDNEEFFSTKMTPPILPGSILISAVDLPEKIEPVKARSAYYEFSVTATGWFNVDVIMNDMNGVKNSFLALRIQGQYKLDFNTMLIIPSRKLFVEGGKLNGSTGYGFYQKDGFIPLPINETCITFAVAENGDKILFGKAIFKAQEKQQISIEVSEINKDSLPIILKALNVNSLQFGIKDSKHANEIRAVDKEMLDFEKWKPKNCDCHFELGLDERLAPTDASDYK